MPFTYTAIIFFSHVLTAGHCVVLKVEEYKKKTVIKYGSHQTDNRMIVVKLGKLPHYHPAYRNQNTGHDIALLFLESDIVISADAFPVCLYHGNEDLQMESRVTVAGFGKMTSIYTKLFLNCCCLFIMLF